MAQLILRLYQRNARGRLEPGIVPTGGSSLDPYLSSHSQSSRAWQPLLPLGQWHRQRDCHIRQPQERRSPSSKVGVLSKGDVVTSTLQVAFSVSWTTAEMVATSSATHTRSCSVTRDANACAHDRFPMHQSWHGDRSRTAQQ